MTLRSSPRAQRFFSSRIVASTISPGAVRCTKIARPSASLPTPAPEAAIPSILIRSPTALTPAPPPTLADYGLDPLHPSPLACLFLEECRGEGGQPEISSRDPHLAQVTLLGW